MVNVTYGTNEAQPQVEVDNLKFSPDSIRDDAQANQEHLLQPGKDATTSGNGTRATIPFPMEFSPFWALPFKAPSESTVQDTEVPTTAENEITNTATDNIHSSPAAADTAHEVKAVAEGADAIGGSRNVIPHGDPYSATGNTVSRASAENNRMVDLNKDGVDQTETVGYNQPPSYAASSAAGTSELSLAVRRVFLSMFYLLI